MQMLTHNITKRLIDTKMAQWTNSYCINRASQKHSNYIFVNNIFFKDQTIWEVHKKLHKLWGRFFSNFVCFSKSPNFTKKCRIWNWDTFIFHGLLWTQQPRSLGGQMENLKFNLPLFREHLTRQLFFFGGFECNNYSRETTTYSKEETR